MRNVTGHIAHIIDAMTDASQSLLWVSPINSESPSQGNTAADRRLIRSQALRHYHRQQRKGHLAVRPRQQVDKKEQKEKAGSDPTSSTRTNPRHQILGVPASSGTDSTSSGRTEEDFETVRLQHSALTRATNDDPFDTLSLPSTPHIYPLLYHCTCAASHLLGGV